MLEKIKAALKAAGIEESHAEALVSKVTDESKIGSAITELQKELNGKLSSEAALVKIKGMGLEAALEKIIQSKFDSKISQALKTQETNLREKWNVKEEDSEDKDNGEDKDKAGDDDVKPDDKKFAELRKLIETQGKTIGSLVDDKKKGARGALVTKALKAAELPETFEGNITGETEEEITASVKTFKDAVQTEQQKVINAALKEHGVPENGVLKTTATEEDAKSLAEKANKAEEDKAELVKGIGAVAD